MAHVRKRLTLLCVALALWRSLGVLVAAEQIDQQQLNSSRAGSEFNDVTWVGQTFVPGVSGALSRLEVSLFCFLCAGANPDIIVEVRTTSGGLPTASVLATTTLTGFSSGSSTFYSAVFTVPASDPGTICLLSTAPLPLMPYAASFHNGCGIRMYRVGSAGSKPGVDDRSEADCPRLRAT